MRSYFLHCQPLLNSILGLAIGTILFTAQSFAQQPPTRDATVYVVVEQQPSFPGGISALKEYMQKNLHYPSEAQKASIKGRVFASFTVETDGTITDVQLLKGIGYGCDEEAIRVIQAMPRWTSGSQAGKPMRVRYHLPVLFGIDYPPSRMR